MIVTSERQAEAVIREGPGVRSALLIGAFLSRKGGSRAPGEDLAERLLGLGWEVVTASSATSRPKRLLDMIWTIWRARKWYRVAHVDVFSGRAFFWAEAACWNLRRAGHRYVLTLHGGNLPEFARRWPRRVCRLLGSAAAVTAPSAYLAQQMSAYRDGILILPNALDLSAYEYRCRTRATQRLVWLRAFHEMYNPGMAVRVAALLRDRRPDIELTMVGPDKGDGSLWRCRELAEQLGVSARVHFAGPVPKAEVPQWLNRGDIFLNTTDVDNTPVSVLEAMACGLCVVSTDAGGLPYLLEDVQDALLVPRGNAAAMVAAVERVLTQRDLAHRLSVNARKKAEQMEWRAVLPKWESLLGSVARG